MAEQQFLAIDGIGNPNTTTEYATAVEALYTVAYTLKFSTKKQEDRDFVVAPLEGLWWADDPAAFTARAKDAWHWTLLISLPDWITEPMIAAAKHTALVKKKLPTIGNIRHLTLHEGQCAQALHIGSYDEEGPRSYRVPADPGSLPPTRAPRLDEGAADSGHQGLVAS